jgi:hypothetical protein
MTENGEMGEWSNGVLEWWSVGFDLTSHYSITPTRLGERTMADFEYVACPKCHEKFMAGEEFFRLPQAYCHCPYCGNEFPVGVAAGEASRAADKRIGS